MSDPTRCPDRPQYRPDGPHHLPDPNRRPDPGPMNRTRIDRDRGRTIGTNGVVFYRGRSTIDGGPIVGIMTGTRTRSTNPKTGDMLQTWILRPDMHPVEALATGADASICGDCPYRPHGDALPGKRFGRRLCYVNIMGPASVYRTFIAGRYPDADDADMRALARGRRVRCGSYGDPVAIPTWRWSWIDEASGRTGYTHRWQHLRSGSDSGRWWRDRIMASVDSEDEREGAAYFGWRTFRPLFKGENRSASEIQCPAAPESGARTPCADCRLCSGSMSDRSRPIPSIAIDIHGAGAGKTKAPRPAWVPMTIGGAS